MPRSELSGASNAFSLRNGLRGSGASLRFAANRRRTPVVHFNREPADQELPSVVAGGVQPIDPELVRNARDNFYVQDNSRNRMEKQALQLAAYANAGMNPAIIDNDPEIDLNKRMVDERLLELLNRIDPRIHKSLLVRNHQGGFAARMSDLQKRLMDTYNDRASPERRKLIFASEAANTFDQNAQHAISRQIPEQYRDDFTHYTNSVKQRYRSELDKMQEPRFAPIVDFPDFKTYADNIPEEAPGEDDDEESASRHGERKLNEAEYTNLKREFDGIYNKYIPKLEAAQTQFVEAVVEPEKVVKLGHQIGLQERLDSVRDKRHRMDLARRAKEEERDRIDSVYTEELAERLPDGDIKEQLLDLYSKTPKFADDFSGGLEGIKSKFSRLDELRQDVAKKRGEGNYEELAKNYAELVRVEGKHLREMRDSNPNRERLETELHNLQNNQEELENDHARLTEELAKLGPHDFAGFRIESALKANNAARLDNSAALERTREEFEKHDEQLKERKEALKSNDEVLAEAREALAKHDEEIRPIFESMHNTRSQYVDALKYLTNNERSNRELLAQQKKLLEGLPEDTPGFHDMKRLERVLEDHLERTAPTYHKFDRSNHIPAEAGDGAMPPSIFDFRGEQDGRGLDVAAPPGDENVVRDQEIQDYINSYLDVANGLDVAAPPGDENVVRDQEIQDYINSYLDVANAYKNTIPERVKAVAKPQHYDSLGEEIERLKTGYQALEADEKLAHDAALLGGEGGEEEEDDEPKGVIPFYDARIEEAGLHFDIADARRRDAQEDLEQLEQETLAHKRRFGFDNQNRLNEQLEYLKGKYTDFARNIETPLAVMKARQLGGKDYANNLEKVLTPKLKSIESEYLKAIVPWKMKIDESQYEMARGNIADRIGMIDNRMRYDSAVNQSHINYARQFHELNSHRNHELYKGQQAQEALELNQRIAELKRQRAAQEAQVPVAGNEEARRNYTETLSQFDNRLNNALILQNDAQAASLGLQATQSRFDSSKIAADARRDAQNGDFNRMVQGADIGFRHGPGAIAGFQNWLNPNQ